MIGSGLELGVCESCVEPVPVVVLGDGSVKIAPPRTACVCGSREVRRLSVDEAFSVVSDEAGRA